MDTVKDIRVSEKQKRLLITPQINNNSRTILHQGVKLFRCLLSSLFSLYGYFFFGSFVE
jgi:hypothetical protein